MRDKTISYSAYRGKRVRLKGTRRFGDKEGELYDQISRLGEGDRIRVVDFKDQSEIRDFAARVCQNLPDTAHVPSLIFRQVINEYILNYTIRRMI